MKRIAALFSFACLAICAFGQTTTPNLGLTLPPYAQTNWNIPVNSNFSLIDTAIGRLQVPFQGAWSNTAVYKRGDQVSYSGSEYVSLINSNFNNLPTNASAWKAIPSSAGTVNSGSSGQVATYSATGTVVGGASALPNGIMATTQATGDNTGKVATDAFVIANAAVGPAGPQGPIGPGNGGATVVQCAGTNDTSAIQTALNSAGKVVVLGSCMMGTSSGHLTVSAGTWLDLQKATISYNPSSADFMITNAAQSASAQRSFTDAALTNGSTTITSATAAFTAADAGQSIACVGGIGTAGAVANPVVPDLHTSITNVVNGTTVVLADPPLETAMGVTCSIFTRDTGIRITGGKLVMGGPVAESAKDVIKIKTANDVLIEDVSIYDGASNAAEAGAYHIEILDATNYTVRNIIVHGWQFNQDGVHLTGPLRAGLVDNIQGHSGDDLVAVGAANGDCFGTCDTSVYGVISDLKVSNVIGSSAMNDAGVHVWSPIDSTGTIKWVRNLSIDGVIGTPHQVDNGTFQGLLYGLFVNAGNVGSISLRDVRGSVNEPVSISGANLDALAVRNLSPTPGTGFLSGAFWVSVINTSAIQNMTIDGVNVCPAQPSTIFELGASTTDTANSIKKLSISNIQTCDLAGGQFNPIWLRGGTIGDFSLSRVKMSFNGATGIAANQGIIYSQGVALGAVSLDDVHISFGSSFTEGGFFGLLSTGNLSGASGSLGSLVMRDVNYQAASSLNTTLAELTSLSSFGSFVLNGAYLNNVGSCTNNVTLPTYQAFSNIGVGSITTPSSCASFQPGVPTVVATFDLTNQTASQAQTVIYTNAVANERLEADCHLWTGSTTGTGTVALSFFANSGTNAWAGPTLTMASFGSATYSPVFVNAASNATVKLQTAYSGTGSYNLNCDVKRVQ